MQQGKAYLKRSNEGSAGNLQHNLSTLKQRWENIQKRANDEKTLEITLTWATKVHESLQELAEWLKNAEKFLYDLKQISRFRKAE